MPLSTTPPRGSTSLRSVSALVPSTDSSRVRPTSGPEDTEEGDYRSTSLLPPAKELPDSVSVLLGE